MKITIEGSQGSGKTTVTLLITTALGEAGIAGELFNEAEDIPWGPLRKGGTFL